MKTPGSYSEGPGGNENHTSDPRYVPQDFVLLARELDDKRYKSPYSFPLAQGLNQPPMNVGMNAGNGASIYNTSGAGANSYPTMAVPPMSLPVPHRPKDEEGLVMPIPPVHVQHKHEHEYTRKKPEPLVQDDENAVHSKCLRCKKDFIQALIVDPTKPKPAEPKLYKLCFHCRDLQRQRSRRWQKKTKDKQGACRRCGSDIPIDQQRFVLCPQCRQSLRVRKANRAAQGRCVHCSGPITSLVAKDDSPEAESSEEPDSRRASVSGGSFKVCQRCRENDKIRRTNLERMGNCNRCARKLGPEEQGKHKVCFMCRQKKKKPGSISMFTADGNVDGPPASGPSLPMAPGMQNLPGPQQIQPPPHLHSTQPLHSTPHVTHGAHVTHPGQPLSHMSEMPPNMMVPQMGYMPMDQNGMLVHPQMGGYGASMPLQEPHMAYGQQMQPVMQGSGELYKPQLPQLQPHMDQGYPQYIGYPPGNRSGPPFSNSRM